jgi:hypothetical protein
MEKSSDSVTRSVRYRINVSTTVKGVKTYDCTVELTGLDDDNGITNQASVLTRSDAMVAELDKRYPPPIAEGKGGT